MPRRPSPPPPAADSGAVSVTSDTAALWRAVCQTCREYFLVLDRTGTILSCSRIDEGWDPEEVLGRDIAGLVGPASAPPLREAIEQVFLTGTRRTVDTIVPRSGTAACFSIQLGPLVVGGRTVAVLACCENTLPLRTSERTLQRERTLLRRLLEIQERERQLISYEIHDGLTQYLAGAMLHLQACEFAMAQTTDGRATGGKELREGLRLLRAATDEARRLIGGLRPPALDELGIIAAVESLAADARIDVPRVEFTHRLPAGRLPPDLETTLFRIVQESLSNVRRHAHAQAVTIRLEQAEEGIRVVVTDDGVGFDPAAIPEDRFGVEGIRQRSRLLGGEPTISSRPGQGTTVSVTLPLAGRRGGPDDA